MIVFFKQVYEMCKYKQMNNLKGMILLHLKKHQGIVEKVIISYPVNINYIKQVFISCLVNINYIKYSCLVNINYIK